MRGVHESNRITQVDSNKKKPSITRVMLWKEVNKWAESEPAIPKDIKIHIKRTHRSWEIANSFVGKKWGMILKYLITDYKSIRSGLYNINFRNNLF